MIVTKIDRERPWKIGADREETVGPCSTSDEDQLARPNGYVRRVYTYKRMYISVNIYNIYIYRMCVYIYIYVEVYIHKYLCR